MKKITTFEAACILCGYGVGGTIMTMPYLATKAGVLPAAIILVLSYLIGMLIAAYTADIALKARSITGHECQVLTQFELFLFNGPLKKILTIIYFVFLALIAVSNLAAYVSESGQLVAALLPVTEKIGSVIFYIFAALVVLAGLKGVAIGERAMVILMFVILAVLAVPSFSHFSGNPLPTGDGDPLSFIRYYGYAILALSAPLAIPQVVDGLDGDREAIKKSMWVGFGMNFLSIIIITFFTLKTATEVTDIAMISWTSALPSWAMLLGVLYILFALITSFWGVSNGLAQIVTETFHCNDKISWLAATLPSFVFALFTSAGFMSLLGIAGGLIGLLNSILVVPLYLGARKRVPETILGGFAATPWIILNMIFCLVYAVGCII